MLRGFKGIKQLFRRINMKHYSRKTDDNQKAIVATLTAIGATVFDCSAVGEGFPDLVVGYHGKNYLIEIKQPEGKMTESQKLFSTLWRGHYSIARTEQEALDIVS